MQAMMIWCLIQTCAFSSAALLRQKQEQQQQQQPDAAKPKVKLPVPIVRPSVEREPAEPAIVRVYHIKTANADEVASVLKRVYGRTQIVADARTNSVIVAAENEAVLVGVQGLISTLDEPVADSGAAETRVIAVMNRPVREITGQLGITLLSRSEFRDCRIAADEGRNMLVLRGTREFLAQTEGILKLVDLSAESVKLEFAFFQASTRADKEEPPKMPADLADVAKELERFGKIELLGRLSSVAVEDEEFKIEGSLGAHLSAQVEGVVLKAAKDGAVRLRIVSALDMRRGVSAKEKQNESEPASRRPPTPAQHAGFRTSTTISTRRGDTVVLGAAPAGWEAGESAILVVRVGK